jgi:hypothetical protein
MRALIGATIARTLMEPKPVLRAHPRRRRRWRVLAPLTALIRH